MKRLQRCVEMGQNLGLPEVPGAFLWLSTEIHFQEIECHLHRNVRRHDPGN